MKLTNTRRTVLSQLSRCKEPETIRILQRELLTGGYCFATVSIYGALRFLKANGFAKNYYAVWEITTAGRAFLAQGGE